MEFWANIALIGSAVIVMLGIAFIIKLGAIAAITWVIAKILQAMGIL